MVGSRFVFPSRAYTLGLCAIILALLALSGGT